MKKILCVICVIMVGIKGNAQVANQYHKFDIGVGVSLKKVLSTPGIDHGIKLVQTNINYNFTPWVTAIGELQAGRLGGIISGNKFQNQYSTAGVRFQVQGGAFIDFYENAVTEVIKNMYVGTGVGLLRFSQKAANLESGSSRSTNFFVPMRIGYEVKLFANNATLAIFDLAYQYSVSSSNGATGFASGVYNDTGHQFSVGLKVGVFRRAGFGRAIN